MIPEVRHISSYHSNLRRRKWSDRLMTSAERFCVYLHLLFIPVFVLAQNHLLGPFPLGCLYTVFWETSGGPRPSLLHS